jgi:hypothetical protein
MYEEKVIDEQIKDKKTKAGTFLKLPDAWIRSLIGYEYVVVNDHGDPKHVPRTGEVKTAKIDLYDIAILSKVYSFKANGKLFYADDTDPVAVSVGLPGKANNVADRFGQLVQLGWLQRDARPVNMHGTIDARCCVTVNEELLQSIVDEEQRTRKEAEETQTQEKLMRLKNGEKVRECKKIVSLQDKLTRQVLPANDKITDKLILPAVPKGTADNTNQVNVENNRINSPAADDCSQEPLPSDTDAQEQAPAPVNLASMPSGVLPVQENESPEIVPLILDILGWIEGLGAQYGFSEREIEYKLRHGYHTESLDFVRHSRGRTPAALQAIVEALRNIDIQESDMDESDLPF